VFLFGGANVPGAPIQATYNYTWYYTTSDGVSTVTRVWVPSPGYPGGGSWAPYNIGVYVYGYSQLGYTYTVWY
jgi:hypothetical protein